MKGTLLAGEPKRLRRRIQQMLLSAQIEAALSKDQIFELYLNNLYLGGDAFGLVAGAQRYFGVEPSQLTLPQAALLAALPSAPNALRIDLPENAQRAEARRRWVLSRMGAEGYLTSAALTEAQAAPLR